MTCLCFAGQPQFEDCHLGFSKRFLETVGLVVNHGARGRGGAVNVICLLKCILGWGKELAGSRPASWFCVVVCLQIGQIGSIPQLNSVLEISTD